MAGQGIHDYGGWAHDSDMMMKSGNKLKHYSSAEGSGGIKDYPDTTGLIQRDQHMGDKQIKKQPMKTGYRY